MDELIESIYKNPGDWQITQFTFMHNSGFKLWVSNGLLFARPYESGMYISFSQKITIWKGYKWWCKHAPIESVR